MCPLRKTSGRIAPYVKDTTVRRASRLHAYLYRMTKGRLGDRLVNNDMLLLTTVGARSRKQHTVPLLYLKSSRGIVVIASYGGRQNHPQWYLNLVAEPSVAVQIGSSQMTATARTTIGKERALLWQRVTAAYSGYAEYQTRTDREIPVVVLELT